MRALDIAGPDCTIDATLHVPAGDGPWPGVLMLTDIRGPRDTFHAMAERLAGEGYAVLLPNIYAHLGRAPVPDLSMDMADPATMPALLKLKATVTPDRMRAHAAAHLAALAAAPEVADAPFGVVGYCMSGQYALHAAEVGGRTVAAAASYHGGELIRDDADSPHRVAAALDTALYFGHAEGDAMIPADRLGELDRTLADAGRDFVSEIYAGAKHGFAASGAQADPASAERHWRTLTQLFARTLG